MIDKKEYNGKLTYVIGHKCPDSDSVGSAIALAYLLNKLGVEAEGVITSSPNKETTYALSKFEIGIPRIIDDAIDKQFVLVDHSEYSLAINNMNKACVIGIIDHHEIGDIFNKNIKFIKSSEMGSTASLIYLMYKEYEIEIPEDIARVMLMSLISDTSNGTQKMTEKDYDIYNDLVNLSNIDVNELYNGMVEAQCNYNDMSDEEIFKSNYKEYNIVGKKIGMSCLEAINSDKAKILANKIYNYMKNNYEYYGMDILYLKVDNYDDNSKEKSFMVSYGDNGVQLLNNIYNNYDGSLLFIFDKNVSRKNDIIPSIKKYLINDENYKDKI